MKKLLLLFLFMVGAAFAQPGNPVVNFRGADPSGSCAPQPLWYNYTGGKLWGCSGGTWALLATGGGGAPVTSVSGTANEITVTGTTTPTVAIAATFDISGHTSTAPIKKGTSLPATCAVGEYYDKTDDVAGVNTYSCTATNTWTVVGARSIAFVAQTDGATVTWAIASARKSNATLLFTTHGGSRTLNITNPVNGGDYVLILTQDGTGGEGLTLGTGCTWKVINGGGGAVTLSTGAGQADVLAFTYDGTNCWATLGLNYN